VLVQNSFKQTASTYVLLQITQESLPLVSIAVSKNGLNYLSTSRSSSDFKFVDAFKFNPNDKIVLNGLLQTNYGAQAVWSSKDMPSFPYYTYATSAKTSVTKIITTTSVQKNFPSGYSTFQLGIESNILLAGKSYEYKLSVGYLNGVDYASASVLIFVNSPPTSGSFSVSPTSGYAFSTNFNFNAVDWIDDAADFPLRYEFFYYLYSDSFNVDLNRIGLSIVKSFDLVPYTSSFIAQGFI
jgi:hypothetical protein